MSWELSFSPTDSEVLGISVVRARVQGEKDLDFMEEARRAQAGRLLILRCAAESTHLVHALGQRGFQLMDTLVYYKCRVRRAQAKIRSSGFAVRPVQSGEAAEIEAIAREAFRGYRSHYHADPRLETEKCDSIYSAWARRACESQDPNETVLVATEGKKKVGFGIMRILSSGDGEAVLAGVRPGDRRVGVYAYQALLAEGTRQALQRGARRAVTSTQINNLVVQRSWIAAGWMPSHFIHTFHKWYDT